MNKAMTMAAVLAMVATASSVWAGSACCGGGMKAAARPASDDQPAAAKAQAECPVMGGPVSRSHYADHEGQRVYFCCGQCVDAFQKDPEKYLRKLAEQGVELEKAPEASE